MEAGRAGGQGADVFSQSMGAKEGPATMSGVLGLETQTATEVGPQAESRWEFTSALPLLADHSRTTVALPVGEMPSFNLRALTGPVAAAQGLEIFGWRGLDASGQEG